jgi:hypothetical protein
VVRNGGNGRRRAVKAERGRERRQNVGAGRHFFLGTIRNWNHETCKRTVQMSDYVRCA